MPLDDVPVSNTPAGCVITLRGAFQLERAASLHRAAIESAPSSGPVTADCSQLQHLDGSAAQILLALKLHLERRGASLTLAALPDSVRDYLAWAGLADHLQP